MTRRGPVPGTTGRPAEEIARVCLDAYTTGRNMRATIAAHYSITPAAASANIARARKLHPIPYDWGHTIDGRWVQCGGPAARWKPAIDRANAIRYAHGTDSAYRDGCRCRKCQHAHAAAAARYRAKLRAELAAKAAGRVRPVQAPRTRTPKAFRPPTPLPGQVHACTGCGHRAASGWELAAHTLERHGRPLTAAERTPLTEENAAA